MTDIRMEAKLAREVNRLTVEVDRLRAERDRAKGEADTWYEDKRRAWQVAEDAKAERDKLDSMLARCDEAREKVIAERDEWRERADRATQEPPYGTKATWVWDDLEDLGQLYMPVCRVCQRGPLTGDELVTGLCGENGCADPLERLRELAQGIREHRNAFSPNPLPTAAHKANTRIWVLLDSDGDSESEGQP